MIAKIVPTPKAVSCLWPISFGPKNLSEYEMQTIIRLLNKSRISSVRILLCDYLQRYNPNYEQYASLEWLYNMKPILSEIEIPYDLVGWGKYVNDPCYDRYSNNIHHSIKLRPYIEKTIQSFHNRYPTYDLVKIRDYVHEECAVSLMVHEQSIIYPYDLSPSIKYIIRTRNMYSYRITGLSTHGTSVKEL